jgi:hypothetical protein
MSSLLLLWLGRRKVAGPGLEVGQVAVLHLHTRFLALM